MNMPQKPTDKPIEVFPVDKREVIEKMKNEQYLSEVRTEYMEIQHELMIQEIQCDQLKEIAEEFETKAKKLSEIMDIKKKRAEELRCILRKNGSIVF